MPLAGYRSPHTVPVRLHNRSLGAVTLLNTGTGELPDNDLLLARALSDSAALSLMHRPAEPRFDDVTTRVQSAIAAKATLEIAKGMIAARHDASVVQAGRLLADHAGRHRVSLVEAALALVQRTMEPSRILGASATARPGRP